MDTRQPRSLSSPGVQTLVAFRATVGMAWGRFVSSRPALAFLLAYTVISGQGSELGTVEDGLVRIVVEKAEGMGVGTGFLLDTRGHIATNHHVVADAARVAVQFSGSSAPVDAVVRWSSKDLELAVIATSPSNRPPLPLVVDIPEKGATVYALGFPAGADIPTLHGLAVDPTVTRGVLGRVFEGTWGTRELTILQHDADIGPGSSGGPLLDECGRAIGINTAGATVKSVDGSTQVLPAASGIYWASSVSELAGELDGLGITYRAASTPCSDTSKVSSRVFAPAGDRSSHWSGGFGTTNVLWLVAAAVGLCLALFALGRNNRRLAETVARIDQQRQRRTTRSAGRHAPASPGNQLVLRSADRNKADSSITTNDVAAGHATGVVVGRHPLVVDCVLNDPDVSRRHIRIRYASNVFQIEDLNSRNGTSLNGTPLNPYRPVRVRAGDRLRCGTAEFDVAIARITESSP